MAPMLTDRGAKSNRRTVAKGLPGGNPGKDRNRAGGQPFAPMCQSIRPASIPSTKTRASGVWNAAAAPRR